MNKQLIQFLPGPVQMYPDVKAAYMEEAYSHRSERFVRKIADLKAKICRLAGAANVQIVTGSGTLANDIIAAQLARLGGHGLILSNGEFGERLIQQASHSLLRFDIYRCPFGEEFDYEAVEKHIHSHKEIT